jgi:hypothetical protein
VKNQNRSLKVRTAVKAGGMPHNHNQGLRLKTRVRAGQVTPNQ